MKLRLAKDQVWIAVAIFAVSISFCPSVFGQNLSGSDKCIKERKEDGKRIYVKKSGWSIPETVTEADSNEFNLDVDETKKVRLKVQHYDFTKFVVTKEPFASICKKDERYGLQRMKRYSINGKVFSYKIQFSYLGEGIMYFYSYFDEDGDGIFETLLFGETSSYIDDSPHVPK